MTAAQVLTVRRVDDDITECRGWRTPIRPGQRAALVLGRGQVHIRCVPAIAAEKENADDE